jgi:hypothetical protein
VSLVSDVREQVDSIEWVHGFGLKIDALRMGVDVDSADSYAWGITPSYGDVLITEETDDGIRVEQRSYDGPYGEHITINGDVYGSPCGVRKVVSFRSYYTYVQHILGQTQPPIEDILAYQEPIEHSEK